ncbi:MAG: type II toxin-antitoxin system VapC family toxin [Phycisphaerae bacterium]|nr:type II toxin-antitoxin system VapC family toxin [Phycisphaerae bacterium]
MMAVLVDSCVLLDVFTEDPEWFDWSSAALAEQANRGALVINPVIYSEISVRFDRIEELESVLTPDVFDYRPIPREAAFLAGKCFLRYRRRGGAKSLPLPDFFIGAHAAVEGLDLLTRDCDRVRTYFPAVKLIHP